MRVIAVLAVIASMAATVALGQESPPVITYRWDEQPDAQAFARNYPQRAVDEGVSGAAVMCCTVNSDRRLNCTAPLEWPAGYGFGDATIAISHDFRLSANSYAEVRADPNHQIRRTIRWLLEPGRSQLPAEFTERARTICNGPSVPVS